VLLGKNLRIYNIYVYYIHLAFVQIEDKDNVYKHYIIYKTQRARLCVTYSRIRVFVIIYFIFIFLFAQLSATYYPIVLTARIARGPTYSVQLTPAG